MDIKSITKDNETNAVIPNNSNDKGISVFYQECDVENYREKIVKYVTKINMSFIHFIQVVLSNFITHNNGDLGLF